MYSNTPFGYTIPMLDYLVERENEEMFRTSLRELKFPDGETRRIETYRLVWAWYDRVIVYEDVPSEEWVLQMALQWAEEKQVPIDEALGQLINFIVKEAEADGADFTDDNLHLTIARQRMAKFQERKEKR